MMTAFTRSGSLGMMSALIKGQLTPKLEQQQSFRRAWKRPLKQTRTEVKAAQDECRAFMRMLTGEIYFKALKDCEEEGNAVRESEFTLVPHNFSGLLYCGFSISTQRYFKAVEGFSESR